MTRTATALLAGLQLTAATALAAPVRKLVEYKSGDTTFEGYLSYDDAQPGPRPGVLVAHNWLGIADETKRQADRVAALGYVVFAADLYGKGVRPSPAEAGKVAGAYKKDRPLLRARMEAGLKALVAQPGVDAKRLAAIGYCFGGTAAIELARAGADLDAVISFHGALDSPTPADGKKIKARVLALHGADDPFVPAADVAAFEDELRKAGVDWQLVKFGGAVHSFTDKGAGSDNTKGAAYNETADRRSFEAATRFFAESFAAQ